MKKIYQKGFTLIELLVVIAIIGILSSVVLASLNSARAKGANAAIKANLANMRAEAELYYSDNNSYGGGSSGGCSNPGTMFLDDATMQKAILAANTASGIPNGAACWRDMATGGGEEWAVSAPLKVAEGTNTHWCVDSGGTSKGQAGPATSGTCLP